MMATTSVSADELLDMGDIGRCELIRGRIIHMPFACAEHGNVAAQLLARILVFAYEHKLGKVYSSDTGFVIERNPDTCRAPDVAFVRAERLPTGPFRKFFPGPPDLAVEVISPSDRRAAVTAKADAWLAAGCHSVWVVDPINRSIEIYRHANRVRRYGMGDHVRDEPMLPGFVLKLDELFGG